MVRQQPSLYSGKAQSRRDPAALVAGEARLFPEIEQVTLFGSRARGDADPRSDVDVAVASPGMTQARWLAFKDALENAPTLLRIDVVRLEEASAAFSAEIRRTGRVIYERGQD